MRLANFILGNVEPIMAEWEAFARSIWPVSASDTTVDAAEVRDHAVQVLHALVLDMQAAQTDVEKSEKSKGEGPVGRGRASVDGVALIHGAERTASGFTLPALIAEYRALRASVLRLWRESNPRPDPLDIDELTRFNESIDQSLTTAVEGFTREAQRTATALRKSEESFHTLAETIPQLAWAAEANGSFYWYNQRWYEYTGTTFEQVMGWGWQSVIEPRARPAVLERWRDSIATGRPFDMTFPLCRADGVFRHFLTRALPLRDESGRVARWFGTNTDITDQRALEQELRAYRADLEQRVEERTRTLEETQASLRRTERMASMGTLAAGMGHDLANLLMPLGMRLDALASEPLSPSGRADVDGIIAALKYLRALAAGLRQMAADPTAPPPPDGIELAGWWAEAMGVVKGVLPRHVHLEAHVPAGLPRVRASRAGLTQAVFNLVQNAGEVLAGAPAGKIGVTAALAPPDDKCCPGGVLVTVADDGPGMTPEVAARCFEPYFSTKGRAVSTGMGLALVRGIADHAGGMVEVASTPGAGAVFTLHLPPVLKPGSPASAVAENNDGALNAVVDVRDARTAALLRIVMAPLGVKGRTGNGSPPPDTALWITDAQAPEQIQAFIRGDGGAGPPETGAERTVLLLNDVGPGGAGGAEGESSFPTARVVYAGRSPPMAALREALEKAAALSRGSPVSKP